MPVAQGRKTICIDQEMRFKVDADEDGLSRETRWIASGIC